MADRHNEPLWYSERLSALTASNSAPELVLLHGWGMSSSVWRGWLPLLRRRCNVTLLDLPGFGSSPFQAGLGLDDLLDQLAEHVPVDAALLGWSLGGALALAFTGRHPRHCAAVMTIASNPCFVARADWPTAMPEPVFREFQASVAQAPQVALQRFCALQARGADGERTLLKGLRESASTAAQPEALLWGLDLLNSVDARAALRDCPLPAVHLFGAADALVPAALAPAVAELAPQHTVALLDGASHLPFITQDELCWQHLDRLLAEAHLLARQRMPQRDKKAVAASFSRAAASYDDVAGLQREVARELLDQVDAANADVLDLGCGTGFISGELAASARQIYALDLAEGMVAYGRARHPQAAIHWLCGDAENLPLADACVDVVVSSLALQWCENLSAVFAELQRVLRPGGCALLATLGPDTLAELRAAWREVDNRVHVNRFASRELIEQTSRRSGLTLELWRERQIVLEYGELRQLTHELKALGAHNVNSGRPDGLSGRARIKQFTAAYERQRNARGQLPATYQVWYLRLGKTDA